jgi:hypothetical protein
MPASTDLTNDERGVQTVLGPTEERDNEPAAPGFGTTDGITPSTPADKLPDPLSTAQLCSFLGCEQHTIYTYMGNGRLAACDVVIAFGRQHYRFSRADALRLKAERDCDKGGGLFELPQGTAYTPAKAAAMSGLSETFVRRCLEKTSLLPEKKLPSLKWPPDAKNCAKPRGNPRHRERSPEDNGLTLILAKDMVRLKTAVRVALKEAKTLDRETWKRIRELSEHLGLTTKSEIFELSQCLECWRDRGLVAHKTVLVRIRMFDGRREGFRECVFYDAGQAKERWQANYLTPGIKAFRALFEQGRKEVPAQEARDALAALGVADPRFRRVVEKAGGCWLRKGRHSEQLGVYVLGAATRPSLASALAELRVNGPPRVKEARATLHALGYSTEAIDKAVKDAGLTPRRGGSRWTPWYWCGPGEQPPAAAGVLGRHQQRVLRALREAGKPLSSGEVARALGETRPRADGWLRKMAMRGLIRQSGPAQFEALPEVDAECNAAAADGARSDPEGPTTPPPPGGLPSSPAGEGPSGRNPGEAQGGDGAAKSGQPDVPPGNLTPNPSTGSDGGAEWEAAKVSGDYCTGSEACRITAMQPSALSKLCRPGGLVRYVRRGRRLQVHLKDLLRYMNERDGKGQ